MYTEKATDGCHKRMTQPSNRFVFWTVTFCSLSLGLTGLLVWEYASRDILVRALRQSGQRQHVMAQALAIERHSATELRKLLAGKTQEVDLLAQQMTTQSAAAQQLEQVVGRQQEHVRQLQTTLLMTQQQVAAKANRSPAIAPAVWLDAVTVPLGSQENTARVLQVNPEWNFVVVNAGWERLGIGDVLQVYRDKALVARAEVERVQEEVAAARVLPAYHAAAIHVNDQVMIP